MKRQIIKCKDCSVVNDGTNFYKAGRYFQSRCKVCMKRYTLSNKDIRRPKKSFDKLSSDKQEIFEQMIADKKTPNEIATALGVKVRQVYNWRARAKNEISENDIEDIEEVDE